MNLVLEREPNNPQGCTLGFLHLPGLILCTIELPWIASPTCNGGLKGKSCVPAGYYRLVRHDSPKHPKTWALVNHGLDVVHYENDDHDPDEDRATCLIHIANYASQLQGCIGIGLAHTKFENGYMVTNSAKAMDKLRAILPYDDNNTLDVR